MTVVIDMRRRAFAATFLIIAFLAVPSTGCHAPTDPLESDLRATVDASVAFFNIEGGCWTIELRPTVHYLPLNLPDEFRHDGLKIRAELLRRDDYGSYSMVGPVVQILSIRAR